MAAPGAKTAPAQLAKKPPTAQYRPGGIQTASPQQAAQMTQLAKSQWRAPGAGGPQTPQQQQLNAQWNNQAAQAYKPGGGQQLGQTMDLKSNTPPGQLTTWQQAQQETPEQWQKGRDQWLQTLSPQDRQMQMQAEPQQPWRSPNSGAGGGPEFDNSQPMNQMGFMGNGVTDRMGRSMGGGQQQQNQFQMGMQGGGGGGGNQWRDTSRDYPGMNQSQIGMQRSPGGVNPNYQPQAYQSRAQNFGNMPQFSMADYQSRGGPGVGGGQQYGMDMQSMLRGGGGGMNAMGMGVPGGERPGGGGGMGGASGSKPGSAAGGGGGMQGGGGQGGNGYAPNPYNPGTMPTQPQLGAFNPGRGTPAPNQMYPGMQMPTTAKPTDAQSNTMDFWRSDKNQDAMAAYANYNLPQQQLQQQAGQYGMDFNENQRRFDTQQGWQMYNDQYSQGLAGRQQGLSEWQAQEAANQFGSQLGFEQLRNEQQYGLQQRQQGAQESQFGRSMGLQELQNQQQYGLANQRFGLEQRQQGAQESQFGQSFGLQSELGRGNLQLAQQQRGDENAWRQTQAQLTREGNANQLTQARYGAFGRASAPGGRMTRNW